MTEKGKIISLPERRQFDLLRSQPRPLQPRRADVLEFDSWARNTGKVITFPSESRNNFNTVVDRIRRRNPHNDGPKIS